MIGIDITGQKFGSLTVIKKTNERYKPYRREYLWLCHCNCGNFIKTRASSLKSGDVKSCNQKCMLYPTLNTKKCPHCNKIKTFNKFYKGDGSKKIRSWCKKCTARQVKSKRKQIRLWARKHTQKQRDNLDDSYIKSLIIRTDKLSKYAIPDFLVILQRKLIILHRERKKLKHEY